MKINLITEEEYLVLKWLQEKCPILTLQNKGYEYIDPSKLKVGDTEALKQIEEILKRAIVGFQKFSNFKLSMTEKLQLRFQYDWGAEDNSLPFTGVGYIELDELLNGFKK